MTWHLRNEGCAVNGKRICRPMLLMRLWPIYQKPDTSRPTKERNTYPNVPTALRVERANQCWCAESTYLPKRRCFLYLDAIIDWRTWKVLVWRTLNMLETDVCAEALNTAWSATVSSTTPKPAPK